jgi:hypothetical protein
MCTPPFPFARRHDPDQRQASWSCEPGPDEARLKRQLHGERETLLRKGGGPGRAEDQGRNLEDAILRGAQRLIPDAQVSLASVAAAQASLDRCVHGC